LSPRFSNEVRTVDGDWLDECSLHETPHKLRTEVTEEIARTILTSNDSPDIAFDRSVNAYRGCEHGCVYCYARPTHGWLGLSPGLDFETRLYAKANAAALLRTTFSRPEYQPRLIALGTNTDPYQPIEGHYRITRALLELMLEARHPVCITTKSARIVEDLSLLARLAELGLVAATLSITTLDPVLARTLEPRASHPEKRMEAVRALSTAGVPTYVNIAPVIPAITDHELESIAARAAEAGARGISAIPLRLPHEVAPLFIEWLNLHFPGRAKRVMAIVRSLRGGRQNDAAFFSRMQGSGPWADLLWQRVKIARRRHRLDRKPLQWRSDLFRPPTDGRQMELF